MGVWLFIIPAAHPPRSTNKGEVNKIWISDIWHQEYRDNILDYCITWQILYLTREIHFKNQELQNWKKCNLKIEKLAIKFEKDKDTTNAAVHPASNPTEPIIPHLTTSEFNIRVHWQFRQKQENHIYNTRLTLAAAFRTNQLYFNIYSYNVYIFNFLDDDRWHALQYISMDSHSSLGSARPADWLNRAKFNLPSSTSRGQSGVLDKEDIVVNSSPQPPGSFPHATRVAANGKQAAPFSHLLRHARGCWGRILPWRPHGAISL